MKCRMSVLRSFSPKGSRVKHWTLLLSHVCSCWRIQGGGVLINSLASLWSALNSSRVHRHKNVKSFGGTKLCSPPPVIFSPIGTPKTVLYTNSFEFSGEMSSHMMGGGYRNKEGCAPLRAAGQPRPSVQPFEEAADVQPPTGWCVAFSRQSPRRWCAALWRELAPGPSPHYSTTKNNFSHSLYLSGFLISSFALLSCNVHKVKGSWNQICSGLFFFLLLVRL